MPSPQSYETFEINIEEATAAVMKAAQSGPKGKVAIDPETVEQDLARLVLALIEFLRQLVELQAIRRMEAGRLSEEEEERLGLTLMRAKDKVLDLAKKFNLEEADLQLNLGPLGRLT